ncbi:MAG TPA: cytochrome c oxidase subunit II [Dictyobacter sp.]|jgi:cytochrome c oxidase subunit 2|nr:cytochrome c oxidase subunit II [Dictyobacter sp.]
MSETDIDPIIGSPAPESKEPRHLRRVLILWAVFSVIGIAVWLAVARFILPPAATDLDNSDNFTLLVFTVLAVPVAMFVWVFLGYSLIVFRVKERPIADGIPLKPTPLLQIGWLSITGILCLFLVIWGLFGFYQETSAAPSNALVVQVTGQQWLWTFYYPQYGVSSQGQVLELPVNRPVIFNVTSKDVLHGFAIRALGVRVDANPGEVTTTPVVTPTRTGSYTVVCVELCGLYHSYMWSAVNVVSESSFSSWVVSQGGHV